jgi:hypothetical protein
MDQRAARIDSKEATLPVLSQYWFSDRFFGGPFEGFNEPYPLGGWAWITRSGQSNATLSWNRADGEQVIDLGQELNNQIVTSVIDGLLPSDGSVSRTSGVLAQGVFWSEVPYHDQDPGRHNDWDMLVRVYFDFHVHTPWYCSDADGNISYYLVFYLDSGGHLAGYVDGWSYHYEGGGPFCTGAIDDALNNAVPSGMNQIGTLLNEALRLLAEGTYSTLYMLPGSGRQAGGDFNENADTDVALGLLPA